MKNWQKNSWAVIDGDVAGLKGNVTVYESATMAILALGLAGLVSRRKQLKVD
ncbi:MAG: PEP-CTERM sorting domain-containing protein [Colwellia sp.]|nr:PEP-CTERM sorting domain-containing protein [Colwellia sp.]